MIGIKLSNDRTEVDIERVAAAFSMSQTDLCDCLRVGKITYWFELGEGDRARPRMIFHSAETGVRVTLDSVGDIISRSGKETESHRVHPFRIDDRDSVSRGSHISGPGCESLTGLASLTCPNEEVRSSGWNDPDQLFTYERPGSLYWGRSEQQMP